MGDWALYRDFGELPAIEDDSEESAATCGACDQFTACPCGCGLGYCHDLCEFVSADDSASGCW